MRTARTQFALALLLELIGAGVAALVATRPWQTITTPRDGQQPDVLKVAGHVLDSAPLAFGLVGLAGVVAVLATRGWPRRVIGALVALAGIALIWRCIADLSAVSPGRARALVRDNHPRVTLSDTVVPHVSTQPLWGVITVLCGLLVIAAGALIAWRGATWAGMSARYERPDGGRGEPDPEREKLLAQRSLWNALDRGEDPTNPS